MEYPTRFEGGPPAARVAPGLALCGDKPRLERLRDDDPDALGELMAEYWAPLMRYARGMLGCADASEDVVQEAFFRLWCARSTLHTRGSERALVYEITRNLALKRVRHLAIRRRMEANIRQVMARPLATPLDQTLVNEVQSVVERALTLLPERRRDAFILLRCRGLSLKEAATAMGLSTQTVANHAVLALKQMRQILRRYKMD
jgi:RNA polymerase sigma factor (sigma-70 family)